ncbi:hypothetical protein V6U90_15115 [Micromonospora sp. CPCC 206060]|uniref:hypothetical protein n=1 Tax=Micromonospora sp. CPCC 206060 TaxID=3122406 RepID=UPI002FF13F9F
MHNENSPPGPASGPPALLVVTVGGRPGFLAGVRQGLTDLTVGSPVRLHPPVPADPPTPVTDGHTPAEYADIVGRAGDFVADVLGAAELHLLAAPTLDDVPAVVDAAHRRQPCRLALLLVDAEGAGLACDAFRGEADRAVERVVAALPTAVAAECAPCTVHVYDEPAKHHVQPVARYTLRQLPTETWILAADTACALADLVETRYARPAPTVGGTAERTLGAALHAFLTDRAGNRWGLHYYTGSVVAALIEDLERRARDTGNPVLRGPSEHSLAAGAMARWTLDGAPYLIVVTSGMVDEFRGTLANLRQAGARGFIVVADSFPDRWYPFQGTVHTDEDTREVLRARRIPAVYLNRTADLATDLAEAFAAYDAAEGPVVLLATPSVLESSAPPPPVPPRPAPVTRPVTVVADDALTPVVRLLNETPATLFWQVGAADPDEVELVHAVAREVGAALGDSLARPGTVSAYRDGRPVEEYLGTLGMYGFSGRVFDYLHRDGRLRPRDEQYLFFLGSRISEVCSPFSERALTRQLRTVQVTANPAHLAPFATHAVPARVGDFLRAVRDRLDVDPQVLALRRQAIRAATDVPDPLALLPSRPMSVNYFLHRLNAVIEQLIRYEDYRYTGVYDVGRGGAAAVRNLVRTGPGFSGWYGRALMGDALQAIPTIALTRDDNVLAFVGDGAAALVPDIMPSLIQQLCVEGHRLRGNLSIFRLCNGGHSIIRTYREARAGAPTGNQTTVLNLIDDDWYRVFGTTPVTHRRLDDVDDVLLRAELTRPGAVNLYTVLLAHNNEGDGLSLLSARSWHAAPSRPRSGGVPATHGQEKR